MCHNGIFDPYTDGVVMDGLFSSCVIMVFFPQMVVVVVMVVPIFVAKSQKIKGRAFNSVSFKDCVLFLKLHIVYLIMSVG